jgi:hypothetical protein
MDASHVVEFPVLESSRDSRISLALTTAWVAGCFVIAWDSLPLPNIGFAQDLGIMLDAGWRFYQGQRTHADYHSPLGPVLGLLFGLPMRILGPRYESLTLLPPFVSAAAAFWTWSLCRHALPALPCAAVSAAIGAVGGGIYHPGFSHEILSFATFYNRVGFACLSIAILAAFLPRYGAFPRQAHLLNGSAIVATVLLFFLKANFVIPAVVCVVIGAICHKRSFWETKVAIAVGSVAFVAFLFMIGFRVDRMFMDLMMAADARREGISNYFFPVRNSLANSDFILLMLVYSVACLPPDLTRGWRWKPLACHLCLIWLPFVLGLMMTVTQSHGDGRGIAPAVSGLAVSVAWLNCYSATIRLPFGVGAVRLSSLDLDQSMRIGSAGDVIRRRLCSALLTAVSLLFLIPHAQSYAQWFLVSQAIKGRQFEPQSVEKLFVGPVVNSWGERFPNFVNEACGLLRSRCSPQDSLQYIDMANPLNFASGLRSPLRSMLWWDISTYTARNHPPVESLRDTQFILLPKVPMLPAAVTQWMEIYGSELQGLFALEAETQHFKLYKRNRVAEGDVSH